MCSLETFFTEQHGILIVDEPSSYHLSPLIKKALSLFLPLILCGGQEEFKLPLSINPFGTWARIKFTHVEFPRKFQLGGLAA